MGRIACTPLLGGLGLAALIALVPHTSLRAADNDADFAARCSTPGVTRCVGFDNTTTDIVNNTTIYAAFDGQFYGTLDTTTKVSGAGSLRFRHRAGANQANLSGGWMPQPSTSLFPALGRGFGQNTIFYVQYRFRMSPEFLSNQQNYWQAYPKYAIFHQNTKSCAAVELTTSHATFFTNPHFPIMYYQCSPGLFMNPGSWTLNTGSPPYFLQGSGSTTTGYNCEYGNVFEGSNNGSGCLYHKANEWWTYYYKITIGTWGSANSRVESWIQTPGDTQWRKWMNVNNVTLSNDGSASDVYNNISFTNYMTGLSASAPVDAFTWYDELVVSTQPIPIPGSSVASAPPSAPANLAVK